MRNIALFLKVTLFLAIVLSLKATAQSDEFISVTKRISPSTEAIAYETKMLANELVEKLEYIKIGSLKAAQENGALSFSIPGYSKRIKANAVRVEYITDNQYNWYGRTQNELGEVIFLSENGRGYWICVSSGRNI